MFTTAAIAATTLTNRAITKIHDSDILTALCSGHGQVEVRFHCTDTPELAQEAWGINACDHLRKLARRRPVEFCTRSPS